MKTMSVKLNEELDARLTAAAQRRGGQRSAIVRDALTAYLDATGNAAGESCLELMADLVGSVKGPRDLSSNPKYLREYGK